MQHIRLFVRLLVPFLASSSSIPRLLLPKCYCHSYLRFWPVASMRRFHLIDFCSIICHNFRFLPTFAAADNMLPFRENARCVVQDRQHSLLLRKKNVIIDPKWNLEQAGPMQSRKWSNKRLEKAFQYDNCHHTREKNCKSLPNFSDHLKRSTSFLSLTLQNERISFGFSCT